MSLNLASMLRESATATPDKPLVHVAGHTFSYAQVDEMSGRAAVIGRRDERLGEEVVAYVSLKPGADADTDGLTAFCKERLAAYKYPREFHLIAELPKGPTGKVRGTRLRQM